MMEIRLNLYQADRDFQVEIGGGGFGYRLFGPKFDGSSRLIKSVILSERDKEEIVRFVKPDAEAVERERDSADERARMLNFQKEKLEAALAAAQGDNGKLREVEEVMKTREDLAEKIRFVLNCASREGCSDTPDFILAEYMLSALECFETACRDREKWYGRQVKDINGEL